MIKNKKLLDKFDTIRLRFEKVEKFANKLPFLSEYIINNEVVEQEWNKLGDNYKSIYFGWGIQRGVYKNNRKVTNCTIDYEGKVLTNIYINTISQYDRHNKYGLEKLGDKVFFYDALNSTFYATDDELEELLESLNDWYLIAKEKACVDNKKDKLDKLEKEKKQIMEGC